MTLTRAHTLTRLGPTSRDVQRRIADTRPDLWDALADNPTLHPDVAAHLARRGAAATRRRLAWNTAHHHRAHPHPIHTHDDFVDALLGAPPQLDSRAAAVLAAGRGDLPEDAAAALDRRLTDHLASPTITIPTHLADAVCLHHHDPDLVDRAARHASWSVTQRWLLDAEHRVDDDTVVDTLTRALGRTPRAQRRLAPHVHGLLLDRPAVTRALIRHTVTHPAHAPADPLHHYDPHPDDVDLLLRYGMLTADDLRLIPQRGRHLDRRLPARRTPPIPAVGAPLARTRDHAGADAVADWLADPVNRRDWGRSPAPLLHAAALTRNPHVTPAALAHLPDHHANRYPLNAALTLPHTTPLARHAPVDRAFLDNLHADGNRRRYGPHLHADVTHTDVTDPLVTVDALDLPRRRPHGGAFRRAVDAAATARRTLDDHADAWLTLLAAVDRWHHDERVVDAAATALAAT